MFTLDDIKPLVKVDGAVAVLVRDNSETAEDIREAFGKQLFKATKLPVFFVKDGIEVSSVTREQLQNFIETGTIRSV